MFLKYVYLSVLYIVKLLAILQLVFVYCNAQFQGFMQTPKTGYVLVLTIVLQASLD